MRNNLLNFAEFERETIAARVADAEVLTREMCNELIEYVKVDRYVGSDEPRDIYIHYKLLDAPMNDNNNLYK